MAWLYKRPGSSKWWIGWRVNKTQYLESTGTDKKAEAQIELERIEAMFSAKRANNLTRKVYESLTGTVSTRPIKTEADEWLKECTGTTAKGTLARYRGIMDDFLQFLKATPNGPLVSEIDGGQVRSYLSDKLGRASVSTVNLERKILSVFFGRSVRNGTIQVNPVATIKKFKATGDEVKRRNLTLEEIGSVYSTAPNDFWRYMIIGGFYTGLREGDLITLDWRSVDFQKMHIRLEAGKTEKATLVPIHPRFAIELSAEHTRQGKPKRGHIWKEQAAIYKKRNASPFSKQFYSILAKCELVEKRDKKVTKNGKAARRETNEVSFHSLRHSFITTLNAGAGSNLVAKELVGHSSDLVNNLYSHIPIEMLEREIAMLPEVAK